MKKTAVKKSKRGGRRDGAGPPRKKNKKIPQNFKLTMEALHIIRRMQLVLAKTLDVKFVSKSNAIETALIAWTMNQDLREKHL